MKVTKADQELIEAARKAIKQRYRNDWQEVGAALRTRTGKVVTGVNLDAYLGRMAVCAEGVALGRVITDLGEAGIDLRRHLDVRFLRLGLFFLLRLLLFLFLIVLFIAGGWFFILRGLVLVRLGFS